MLVSLVVQFACVDLMSHTEAKELWKERSWYGFSHGFSQELVMGCHLFHSFPPRSLSTSNVWKNRRVLGGRCRRGRPLKRRRTGAAGHKSTGDGTTQKYGGFGDGL